MGGLLRGPPRSARAHRAAPAPPLPVPQPPRLHGCRRRRLRPPLDGGGPHLGRHHLGVPKGAWPPSRPSSAAAGSTRRPPPRSALVDGRAVALAPDLARLPPAAAVAPAPLPLPLALPLPWPLRLAAPPPLLPLPPPLLWSRRDRGRRRLVVAGGAGIGRRGPTGGLVGRPARRGLPGAAVVRRVAGRPRSPWCPVAGAVVRRRQALAGRPRSTPWPVAGGDGRSRRRSSSGCGTSDADQIGRRRHEALRRRREGVLRRRDADHRDGRRGRGAEAEPPPGDTRRSAGARGAVPGSARASAGAISGPWAVARAPNGDRQLSDGREVLVPLGGVPPEEVVDRVVVELCEPCHPLVESVAGVPPGYGPRLRQAARQQPWSDPFLLEGPSQRGQRPVLEGLHRADGLAERVGRLLERAGRPRCAAAAPVAGHRRGSTGGGGGAHPTARRALRTPRRRSRPPRTPPPSPPAGGDGPVGHRRPCGGGRW